MPNRNRCIPAEVRKETIRRGRSRDGLLLTAVDIVKEYHRVKYARFIYKDVNSATEKAASLTSFGMTDVFVGANTVRLRPFSGGDSPASNKGGAILLSVAWVRARCVAFSFPVS